MFARLSRMASGSSTSRVPPQKGATERVPLAELNGLLDILASVFPAHEVALLRDLLLEASSESRLHVAANALIQRYADKQSRAIPGQVAEWEKFRSSKYKNTVENLLVTEYQGLAKSTVRNVLIENNHDYVRSHDALAYIASRSWRYSLAAWISRRKMPPALSHIDVVKKSTGCMRLDDEIYALGQPERDVQSARDGQLAREINEGEYTEAHAFLECECCFGDYTWEDITTCTNGHFFCRACLDQCVKEALYGQGSCLCLAKASIRCISSAAISACDGFVAPQVLQYSLPPETLAKLEQRFARDQLQTAGLQLVRCPACPYAVVDNTTTVRLRFSAKITLIFLVPVITFWLCHPRAVLTTLAYLSSFLLLYFVLVDANLPMQLWNARICVHDALTRVRRRKTGTRQLFKCENPSCGMASCIDCGRVWAPFHDCLREDSQRLYVERAMSEAVKRTCPQCRTSFVKTDGCNKLTCQCGYQMCYVCRADVRSVGYWHFCQHFHSEPGAACTECDKCNLYETENEQEVAAAAARRAAEEWAAGRRDREAGMVGNRLTFHSTCAWPPWAEQQVERFIELLLEW